MFPPTQENAVKHNLDYPCKHQRNIYMYVHPESTWLESWFTITKAKDGITVDVILKAVFFTIPNWRKQRHQSRRRWHNRRFFIAVPKYIVVIRYHRHFKMFRSRCNGKIVLNAFERIKPHIKEMTALTSLIKRFADVCFVLTHAVFIISNWVRF